MLLDLRLKTQVVSNSNMMVLWLLGGFRLGVVWVISCTSETVFFWVGDGRGSGVFGWPPYTRTSSPYDTPSPVPCVVEAAPEGSRTAARLEQRTGRDWEGGLMRPFPGLARNISFQGSSQESGAFSGCT